MLESSTIRIGDHKFQSTKQIVRRLKTILDQLKVPHILDDVSFHNTLLDLYRMKYLFKTDVWKVEKDGSVSLKNRFGHNGRFENRCLTIRNLLEFQFVDLSVLDREDAEFLSNQIYEFEIQLGLSTKTGQGSMPSGSVPLI
ncbi:MAG: hypothetical protein PVF37_07575 [Desulfobacterales bacterium]